ncbi:hypothetical protein GCK72_011010 [Caenorhabditis remanei]|uniref:EGF-like domain-containing protein n=1 Tax=Caenorhabditis remanei TaxID=31234 RepID=A0A6A5H4V7_CAERE|nr:hypothetical protein GCK72_011010 [Caenorhabditis remanei]KAF1762748.1 hypothetical protein GCK72_011010 [Caenorhabditis remanei]
MFNPCNAVCGPNAKCGFNGTAMFCTCGWGWTGERCDRLLKEKYKGNMGYSTTVGATITLGGLLFRILKVCIIGITLSEQEDDPQDTHQRFRSYLMSAAGIIMTLFSNPTVFGIDQPTCRFYFIALHFCYIMAMCQWVWEGFNVNQVIRFVHANEWERDWYGNRPLGVRLAPRMIGTTFVVSSFLLITFQTGWYRLAAEWTCVGVVCQETVNIWFPIFFGVCVLAITGLGIYEWSFLIERRRPLLGYMIKFKIERELGHVIGRRIKKCRDNDFMALMGLVLLIIQWLSVIFSSDRRDDPMWGVITVVTAGIYSAFCAFQEIMTCPEDKPKFVELFQRFAPDFFAPTYNETTMWSIFEVRQMFKLPKEEREAAMEGYLTMNEQLYLHHRWNLRLNHFLGEELVSVEPDDKINEALQRVYLEEMRRIEDNNGTDEEKRSVQQAFTEYYDSIPYKVTPDAGELEGRLELVTLATEDPKFGIRLAKFFIVPEFHTFQPEVPAPGQPYERWRETLHERRFYQNLEKDIYLITRQAAHEQATFINSAILFSVYGNNVAR